MEKKDSEGQRYARAERRIAWLTPALGVAAGAVVAFTHGWRWGLGIAVGGGLGWLNFHWLRQGLDAMQLYAAGQAGEEAPKVKVPLRTWLGFGLRYGLLAAGIYVIFVGAKVPILSMIVGLCALGAATLAASVIEILHPSE
jgi:hypothetical protein